jgi:diacylglycerol O-acyltransferase / wax synthase
MGLLLDLSPEGRELPDAPRHEHDHDPGDLELLGRGLLGLPRYPLRLLRSLPAAVPNIEDTPFGTLPGAGAVGRLAGAFQRALGAGDQRRALERKPLTAPRTSFNGRISPHRRFAFGKLPLDAVKAVKNAHGCTVNDVVVSICASAVRRWLIDHDELPPDPLIAQIPISVRTSEQTGTYGNRIMLMAAPLFTNEPDPIRRLYMTHEAMLEVKERHKALPAELLQDANHFIPPAVFHRAAQLTFRLSSSRPGRPTWNLVVSNVPGPQFPLYMAGARLEANYPVSVITDGMGLNITVMSYNGDLDFGLVGDRDQIPDLWCMVEWLREGLDELLPRQAPDPEAAPASAT